VDAGDGEALVGLPSVTVAVVATLVTVWPALDIACASAMEKQPACCGAEQLLGVRAAAALEPAEEGVRAVDGAAARLEGAVAALEVTGPAGLGLAIMKPPDARVVLSDGGGCSRNGTSGVARNANAVYRPTRATTVMVRASRMSADDAPTSSTAGPASTTQPSASASSRRGRPPPA